MAITWSGAHHHARRVALVASTNDHVDLINRYVQVHALPHRRAR